MSKSKTNGATDPKTDPTADEIRAGIIETLTVDEIMTIRLTGVVASQPCVITESGTDGNGVQFDGTMNINYGTLTVGDVVRRATSNIVIAAAPPIRKNIMEYRSKKTIDIDAPRPGKRERATAITTKSDVIGYLAGKSVADVDAILEQIAAQRDANVTS